MAEENEDIERDEEFEQPQEKGSHQPGDVIHVAGMYRNWFMDYASYVILERAIPAMADGLKPVQRRILHSMRELEDGRYHKVANLIGHTMKYHPHGDQAIGDALVQLGQKELLIDTQGNWGNTLTGDRAAAPRYIEARLTKFALEVVFNNKTTEWLASYDGRGKEPVHLPVKFPLLLAQGADGIAVGLSTKILPHNFNELIDASIKVLKGQNPKIVPDFLTGGTADFSDYKDGRRGGKVKVRARIKSEDKKTLVITEIPYGTTTTSLIESILKANDKGKIKIRKVEDNTAENVEILVHLPPGVSPDKMIDALYAFTDCEVSISPNACVIENDTPRFVGVSEMLQLSTDRTLALLKEELEIKLAELQEQWHFASLEKIFIENRIYRDIEECETWEAVIEAIDKGIHKYISTPSKKNKKKEAFKLIRDVTEEDIVRLTEIKIKRISKFDSFKADEQIKNLESAIKEVKHNLKNLVDFAIDYFKNLKQKYGKGRERKTEKREFDTIVATKVAVANAKLYVNRAEGFAGTGLRRTESEFVCDCSDIDDIIAIRKDGKLVVSRISDKAFLGKDLLHIGVWKKGDARTVYNLIYQDGQGGPYRVKRFNVTGITRDKEYDLTKGTAKSKIVYLTANPNGEAETVQVILRARPKLKKLKFDFNFSDLDVKGRGVGGNILTKYAVNKIMLKEEGLSTLSARKIWFDDTVQRLNTDERGEYLGQFQAEDKILTIMQSGVYELTSTDLFTKFSEDMIHIEKWNPKKPLSIIYYHGGKKQHYVKRFLAEDRPGDVLFISEEPDSKLELAMTDWRPQVQVNYRTIKGKTRDPENIVLEEFMDVKGLKTLGNQLSRYEVKGCDRLDPLPYDDPDEVVAPDNTDEAVSTPEPVKEAAEEKKSLKTENPKPTKVEMETKGKKREAALKKESSKASSKSATADDDGQITLEL